MKRVLPLLLLGGLIAGCSSAPPQGTQTGTFNSGRDFSYDSPDSRYSRSTTATYEAEPSTNPEIKGAYNVPGTSSAATQSHADVSADIAAVKNAKGPGAAIDAYAHGYAANPNSALLEEAYIRKMIDFDLPQDAVGAARRLTVIAPDSSLARSVVAFDEARRGDLPDAVEDIVLAAQKMPEDPFVQIQAARILSWYDNTPQKPPVSKAVKDEIPGVRQKLEQHPAYVTEYQKASDFYKQMMARATTQPSGPTTAPSAGYAQEAMGGVAPYAPPPMYEPQPWTGADYGPDYYGPDYYEPYYPYDYWGWSPFFFGADFAFFNHYYHHDHFRDRGHDHDGRGGTSGTRIDHSAVARPDDGFKSLGSLSAGSSARFYSPSYGSAGGQVARPSSSGTHFGGGYTGGHYGGGYTGGHYGGGFGGGAHYGGGFGGGGHVGGGGGGGHR